MKILYIKSIEESVCPSRLMWFFVQIKVLNPLHDLIYCVCIPRQTRCTSSNVH